MTLLTQSPEKFTSSNDSLNAKNVNNLDAQLIKEIAQEIAKENYSNRVETRAETSTHPTDTEEKFKYDAGNLALHAAFSDISIDDYTILSKPQEELYPYPSIQVDSSASPVFGYGDELFSTGDQAHDTTYVNRDSHKTGFDIDD
jgi:hypothetical protein